MAARRHSRTPLVLTKSQQEALVAAMEEMPDVVAHLEVLLKVSWKDLTFGEKLAKIDTYQEAGYALGSIAGAARGARDLAREAQYARDEADTADQLRIAQERERTHLEQLAALQAENNRLRGINSLRGKNPTTEENQS